MVTDLSSRITVIAQTEYFTAGENSNVYVQGKKITLFTPYLLIKKKNTKTKDPPVSN
jgi:hypothetical protein